MAAKKNAAAQDLRTPKYRPRIVKNLKKAYLRRPKHPASAADAFWGAQPLVVGGAQRAATICGRGGTGLVTAVPRRVPRNSQSAVGGKRHAQTVMPEDLDEVASGTSENIQIAAMGIVPKRLLDLKDQAVHALSHLPPS
ncbi:MAG: hypothetical protein WCC64_02745 [Aliidongia sp.]